MQYLGLGVLMGCVAALLLFLTLRLGGGLEWLLGWLKGCALLILLALSGVIGLLAWELAQFQPISDGARVATLEFDRTAAGQHDVRLMFNDSVQRFPVQGQLWEMDVQVLRWRGLPRLIGLEDGYRLNALRGRYLALELQRELDAQHLQARPLHQTPAWRDAWHWLDKLELGWLYTDAFAIRFMPLADGARFAVEIGATGLSPVAMNTPALEAMKGLE